MFGGSIRPFQYHTLSTHQLLGYQISLDLWDFSQELSKRTCFLFQPIMINWFIFLIWYDIYFWIILFYCRYALIFPTYFINIYQPRTGKLWPLLFWKMCGTVLFVLAFLSKFKALCINPNPSKFLQIALQSTFTLKNYLQEIIKQRKKGHEKQINLNKILKNETTIDFEQLHS